MHIDVAALVKTKLWRTPVLMHTLMSFRMMQHNIDVFLRFSELLHGSLADFSGVAVSFTTNPEIQLPLLAVQQHSRAPGPQTGAGAVHLQE